MKSPLKALVLAFVSAAVALLAPSAQATSLMENLGRGIIAVRTSTTDVYVSWRMLGTDPTSVAFNLYRSTGGGAPVLLNASPIDGATIFTDSSADLAQTNAYFVRPIVSGVEQAASAAYTLAADAPVQQYLRVPLQRPAGGTTPDGVSYTYSPNDCSVADLDGDGEYEIIVKWDPSNSHDNSQSGYTGNVYLDAYKLDGTFLWRIDLGRNIRAGAHYTQFLAYDFDGDGKAELVCKTAPNTKDGTGAYIGAHFLGTPSAPIDHNADYRNSDGYVLTGPEFFTVFNGQTGAELATTNYVVPRNSNPASGDVTAWGDDYGNRVDRFLACVAYLDGQRPSFVLCRGYYTRAVLAAWDWRNGQLTQRWVADTGNVGTINPLANWRGQGAHSLTVGDVDDDGRDEITYGAAAFDDDGTGLYSTLLGHGDALHLSKMDPNRPGQQVWMVHEEPTNYGPTGLEFRDAKTGQLIFGLSGQNADVGRGVAGDIDPRYVGYEMWGARGGLMAVDGTQITSSRPSQMNFMVWWDGDLLRELLDGTTVYKWDWNNHTSVPILAPSGISSNNSTKSTPNLSADIFGDWREEIVWRENTNDALRIYTTTIPTTYRFPTLMHDRQYRLAIAWQNVGYNQPPHPSFYLGEGMTTPPQPDIVTSLGSLPATAPAVVSINRYDPATASTGATSVTFRVTFNTAVTGVDVSDFTLTATGTIIGSLSSVTALSSYAYNVTVGSITGTGTIRVDLKPSGTGITGPSGAPISGGFTGGQLYNRATLAWIDQNSGGLWSDPANWDGGVIADGVGAVPIFGNFDLLANNMVQLDSPRTVSGLTFGDTAPGSAASWTISDNGDSANVLTLDVASGTPTNTVNTLGTGATATLDVGLASTDGLGKAGTGTLVLTKPSTISGNVSVTAGTLRLDTGGALTLGNSAVTVNTTGNATLLINGGDFTTGGLTTLGGGNTIPGIFRINAGTAALNGGIRTNNDSSSTVRVTGGTFTASDVNIRRNSASSVDFGTGFVVTGGNATVGTIQLGTNNSNGAMSVEGGTLTATGAVTVGNQATAGRGGAMRVIGGTFISTNTATGVVLSKTNGTNANNVVTATFSGGTSFIEKLTLGFDSTVNAGSATVNLNGGTLYLGSGGIVKNGVSGFTTTLNFNSGVLGAKASWATSHAVVLGGNVTIKAADANDAPFAIAFNGAVSGGGGFTKTGGGTLTLDGTTTDTYGGTTTVTDGTLRVTGTLAAAANGVALNGGALTGNGTINRSIALNSGATIAPDGATPIATLSATTLTWNGGGTLAADLGADGSSDVVALSGALTKGTTGTFNVAFTPGTGFATGNVYTLATFASTNFDASDFTASGLPTGTGALFMVKDTSLQVRIQGAPHFTSADTAMGTYGAPFTYVATVDDAPATFGASNLPPGLSFDPATGTLSGVPAAAGSYTVSLSATNTAGTSTTSIAVIVGKAAASVSLGNLSATYDGAAHAATSTTTPAGLAVVLTYNGAPAAPVNAGTYAVVGAIDDPNYTGSASGTLTIAKATQTIAFPNPGAKTFGDASFALNATATSALPVSYAVVGGPATVTGNVVTITGAGTVAVRASQAGDNNYVAAPDVEVSFTVAKATATLALSNLRQTYDGTPKPVTITTDPTPLTVNVTYNGTAIAPKLPGTYTVVATIDDVNYSGTSQATLVVGITALVRHAPDLNGDLEGSVQVLSPEGLALNGSSLVANDLLLPGTPAVRTSGQATLAGVQDENGSATPSNYVVVATGNAMARYIVRRVDPIPMPVVSAPQPPTGTRDVYLNSDGDDPGDFATVRDLTINGGAAPLALPPGVYRHLTANSAGFVLGTAGATAPAVYDVQQLTLNGHATLEVMGPVILRVGSDVVLSSAVGAPTDASPLTLELATGNVTLNGGATVYATLVAPNGRITINGNAALHGSVTADRLTINGTGLLSTAP